LGDDLANPAVLWLGDSIGYGTGIYKFNFGNQSPQLGNMFDASFANGQFAGTTNAAIPSARLDQLLSGATSGWIRLKLIQYADYVINQLGTNDLVNGQTWQQLASNHLRLAALVVASGGRYAATTIIPRTTSTDGWRTASNQAVLSSESNRVNYNTWLRNGSQVDVNLNPVLSGGTSSPYMYGFIDIASALEVNSANILTQNGGFWQAPTAAAFNQIATGVPTTTSLPASAANYPLTTATNLGVCTYTLQMTSGGANGQLAVVTSNTATTLTLFANGNTSLTGVALPGLTIAPAAADTFSLWLTSTVDGVHGLWPSYQICAATVGAWLSSRIVKYGAMLGI
jgi:hypothetical protein